MCGDRRSCEEGMEKWGPVCYAKEFINQSRRGETAGESGRFNSHSKNVLRLSQRICYKKGRMAAKGLDVAEDKRRQGSR